MTELDDVVRQLVEARRARGMSQNDVAARMGITQSTVSQLERGRDSILGPSVSVLQRYASAVGVTLVVELVPVVPFAPIGDQ
jgi:transcriptional regulator with XRE-family HTH domain